MASRTAEKVRHLTAKDLSERLADVSVETLREWRRLGKGPKYLRGEGGSDKATILYRLKDVEDWEESRLVDPAARNST